MSTALPRPSFALLPLHWGLFFIGMAALFVPTLRDLLNGIWASDAQGHGPIVLGVGTWLIYRRWAEMEGADPQPRRVVGLALFVLGLLLYLVGRSQMILGFEVGASIVLLVSAILAFQGRKALRMAWFGLFFLLFMIPLPGPIVDALTQPMKLAVSYVSEAILGAAGYPISRSGVTIQIGDYQLLVADACAGLHTLFTLEAMGLLYLNLVQYASFGRNLMLAILIVPISFTANVIRVMVLTLITYHLGDEAGQGFLHGFAGFLLFVAALLLIMTVDGMLRLIFKPVPELKPAAA